MRKESGSALGSTLIISLLIVIAIIAFSNWRYHSRQEEDQASFEATLRRARTVGSSVDIDDVYKRTASDAAAQYEIAKREGDPLQICVQAGFASAAYLQAKDESTYRTWKAKERSDCARAGITR
ncbi:hypothetical protein K8O61_13425 [Xanthomonas cerealis pv. cerealis]|uniref:pilus assembly FimT family protein n=1 Tax=Xanthomonas cerealis TaxID=3390025 RepID=UPI0018C55EAD|nr:hypothetical protein [Xanthomonas translucens]UKE71434.1 hypothetical protein K8O61_13425 [Xanthomonas translucens pv. pistacia]